MLYKSNVPLYGGFISHTSLPLLNPSSFGRSRPSIISQRISCPSPVNLKVISLPIKFIFASSRKIGVLTENHNSFFSRCTAFPSCRKPSEERNCRERKSLSAFYRLLCSPSAEKCWRMKRTCILFCHAGKNKSCLLSCCRGSPEACCYTSNRKPNPSGISNQ